MRERFTPSRTPLESLHQPRAGSAYESWQLLWEIGMLGELRFGAVGVVLLLVACQKYQRGEVEVRDCESGEPIAGGRVMWEPGLEHLFSRAKYQEARLDSDGRAWLRYREDIHGQLSLVATGYPAQYVSLRTPLAPGEASGWLPLHAPYPTLMELGDLLRGTSSRDAQIRFTRVPDE
jgi:hypothetical protein